MKFAVESHLALSAGAGRLVFKHPDSEWEVHLENHDVRPGAAMPILWAYVIFPAPTMAAAEEAGTEHLNTFLDALSFAADARSRIHHPLMLFDWTPRLGERVGRIYRTSSDPALPAPVLDTSLLPALEFLSSAEPIESLARGLRLFRLGVSSDSPEEQFEMFWFVVETVSQYNKSAVKVPSACPRCKEPLYCRKCQEVPLHRPYPSQAIERVFNLHLKTDKERWFSAAQAMRHALLHGDSIKAIEAQHNTSLGELVNVVGRIARDSLFRAIRSTGRSKGKPHLTLLQSSDLLHRDMLAQLELAVKSPQDRDPEIDDLEGFGTGVDVRIT